MIKTWLSRRDCEDGSLPHVCVVCGEPASECVEQDFSRSLLWDPTMVFTPAAWQPAPYHLPTCARHRHYWRDRRRLMLGLLAASFVPLVVWIVGCIFEANQPGPLDEDLLVTLGVVACGCPLGASGIALLYGTNGIRATAIQENGIELVNVNPRFADDYDAQLRRMRRGEREPPVPNVRLTGPGLGLKGHVWVRRRDCVAGTLPLVCLWCGGPASRTVEQDFFGTLFWSRPWAYPFAAADRHEDAPSREDATIRVPMCQTHHHYWRKRRRSLLAVAGVGLVSLAGCITAVVFGKSKGDPDTLASLGGIGAILTVFCGLFVYFYGRSGIRATEIRKGGLDLYNVDEFFVEVYEKQKSAADVERKLSPEQLDPTLAPPPGSTTSAITTDEGRPQADRQTGGDHGDGVALPP